MRLPREGEGERTSERGDRGIDKERDGDATGRDGRAEEGKNNKWLAKEWKAFRGCVFCSAVRHLRSVSLPLPSVVEPGLPQTCPPHMISSGGGKCRTVSASHPLSVHFQTKICHSNLQNAAARLVLIPGSLLFLRASLSPPFNVRSPLGSGATSCYPGSDIAMKEEASPLFACS